MASLFPEQTSPKNKSCSIEAKPAPVYKLKSERVEEWQAVAKRMFAWYDQLKELPTEPVQINRFSKIVNVKKFIETQRATIEANFKDPFCRGFNSCYMRLFYLKKFIENEQLRTANGKP